MNELSFKQIVEYSIIRQNIAKMDYGNGKVYKIVNSIDEDVYIGATCQPLSKRMAWHRQHSTQEDKSKRKLYIKMAEHGIEHFSIVLIEECPCENVEQLRKKEAHYIREQGTLNHVIPLRTSKEYKQDNIERTKETQREYNIVKYANNKAELLRKNKIYRDSHQEECRQTRQTYYKIHREDILIQKKIYGEKHKEDTKAYNHQYHKQDSVKEKAKITYVCECGSQCRISDKARHIRSKKHQKYEADNK